MRTGSPNAVGAERFAPLPMAKALDALIGVVERLGRTWREPRAEVHESPAPRGTALSQVELWSQIARFLQPNDIVVAEQGTAYYGVAPIRLPRGVRFIGQPLWGSIGYTLPAAYGAQLAAPARRVILLIGDGSAQLTAQEIGSMLRDGIKPIIVVIDNDGYTVERAIHGPEEPYNDIPRWDWSLLPRALGFGARSLTLEAHSAASLETALATAASADCLVLLQARLPKHDLPALLAVVAQAVAERNAA
jgi:indolepyruvate decarboxylase